MPASIGVNLRVTGHCRQGGRKYMEDFFSVAYQQTEDERDLEYAFFGIYDGHGGAEAAAFAKEHLMETIIKHKTFWSENDDDVLRAIKDGYIATHYAMWREQEKWPRTASGLPSTAGTTASVAFIRRGKIYIGHVGDSGIILGYQENGSPDWKAKPLTTDHKPENVEEMIRISQCGGKVVSKSGVPRVVWNRPKMGHQGPVRRSTPIDEIPFLAVARSLGDLWSYNSQINQFIVSPDPDCSVVTIDTNTHRCLIFGTDGLLNMLTPDDAVHIVQQAEKHNENAALSDSVNKTWLNPSKLLVEKALERWHVTRLRADNTSVVTLMLDPPGPPRAQVLKNLKLNNSTYPDSGLKIMTRFEDNNKESRNPSEEIPNRQQQQQQTAVATPQQPHVNEAEAIPVSSTEHSNFPLKEHNFASLKPRDSLGTYESCEATEDKENVDKDTSIQINEISSSSSIEENCEEDENSNEIIAKNLRSSSSATTTTTTTSSTGTTAPLVATASTSSNTNKTESTTKSTIVERGVKRKATCECDENKIRKSSRIEKILKKTKVVKSLRLKKKLLQQPKLTKNLTAATTKKTNKKQKKKTTTAAITKTVVATAVAAIPKVKNYHRKRKV